MEAVDPHRIEVALVRTTRAIRRAFNQRLAQLGFSMTRGALLAYVHEHGSLTQRELADLLHITKVSTGTFVAALEQRGLRRTTDPADRRVWLTSLTDEGEAMVRSFDAIDQQPCDELRVGLTRSERQQLASLLARLETNACAAMLDTDAAAPPSSTSDERIRRRAGWVASQHAVPGGTP